MVMCVIVCLIVGYLFGCIQTGYFVGRANKIDIRDYGSGNSGTTNTLRTLGKTAAVITFLGDAVKGLAAVNIARYIIIPYFGVQGESTLWLLTGFAVVLGHNFPFFLGFKGGKGIATTGGVIFAFHWQLGLICAVVFLIVTAVTKYVSLGSICMVLIIPFILYFKSRGSAVIGIILVIMTYYFPKELFMYLLSIVVAGLIISWFIITITHMKFRLKFTRENRLDELKFKSLFYPYTNYFCILFLIAVVVIMTQIPDMLISIIVLPIWVIFIYMTYLFKKKD